MIGSALMCIHKVTHHQQLFMMHHVLTRFQLLMKPIPFVSSSSSPQYLDMSLVLP